MNIEVWTSDKGQEEIHHFLEGEQNTYVYGINAQLLGMPFCMAIRDMIEERLDQLEHSPFNYAK